MKEVRPVLPGGLLEDRKRHTRQVDIEEEGPAVDRWMHLAPAAAVAGVVVAAVAGVAEVPLHLALEGIPQAALRAGPTWPWAPSPRGRRRSDGTPTARPWRWRVT